MTFTNLIDNSCCDQEVQLICCPDEASAASAASAVSANLSIQGNKG